jgi:hypothetical protein
VNQTLKGLPDGNAELHYAAKVEPYRQGLLPRPAAIETKAVSAAGEVTFDLTPRVEYVVFDAAGKGHNCMYSTTRGGTP